MPRTMDSDVTRRLHLRRCTVHLHVLGIDDEPPRGACADSQRPVRFQNGHRIENSRLRVYILYIHVYVPWRGCASLFIEPASNTSSLLATEEKTRLNLAALEPRYGRVPPDVGNWEFSSERYRTMQVEILITFEVLGNSRRWSFNFWVFFCLTVFNVSIVIKFS